MTEPDAQRSRPPTTTAQQDATATGRRRINVIWEITQALIALVVVGTAMYTSARIALIVTRLDITDKGQSIATMAFVLLSNTVFLVIGFYFGRANHQRQGGVPGAAEDNTR